MALHMVYNYTTICGIYFPIPIFILTLDNSVTQVIYTEILKGRNAFHKNIFLFLQHTNVIFKIIIGVAQLNVVFYI